MNKDEIKMKQQKMIYQVIGTTALPPTGKIEITDIFTTIKQGNTEATAKIYNSNPDSQIMLGLYINIAASLGHLETIKFLVEKGANPDNGLGAAAENNHITTVNYLIEQGATSIQRAITKSIDGNHIDMLDNLISKGGNFDYEESEPLRWAAMGNKKEIVYHILVNHRAEPTPFAKEWLKEKGCTYPLELLEKRNLQDKLQQKLPAKPSLPKKMKQLGMKL